MRALAIEVVVGGHVAQDMGVLAAFTHATRVSGRFVELQ
jgi:hypothetical protein